jgi:hypothetical protein
MLVTDLAIRDMEDTSRSVIERLWCSMRRALRGMAAAPVRTECSGPHILTRPISGAEPAADATIDERFRWRRHPILRSAGADDREERGAGTATMRAMFLARSARLDEARRAFAQAASDPAIDLSSLPGFWDLSRGAMLAAVDAYEDAGRIRDAANLEARIRLQCRPRALPVASPAPVSIATRQRERVVRRV